MTTITMPSANGKGAVYIEKILDEELGDKCAFYAKVTRIPRLHGAHRQ